MSEQNKRTNPKYQAILQLILLIAIIIAANILSTNVYQRLDLTKEKRFTLSDATQNLLYDLDDVVYITVFLEGEFPAGFKRLRNATVEMLNEFRAYAGNNIEFRFENPLETSDPKERAAIVQQLFDKGLEPRRLVEQGDGFSEKIIFPGATVAYRGRELPVNLLQQQLNKSAEAALNESIALLEYNMANAIQKLQRDSKPQIAFLEGHGELVEKEVADMAATLSKYYVVNRLDLTERLAIPQKYSAVVIARPTQKFEESNKYKLDQYIMNGGRVLWLVEHLASDLDSLRAGKFVATDMALNLEDMLFKYGVRINFDLIQDVQCTKIPLVVGQDQAGNATQTVLRNWIYSPVLTQHSQTHPITKNLDAVLSHFAASIDVIQTKGANVQPAILLSSSPYSRSISTPIEVSIMRDTKRPDPKKFENSGNIPIAVALEGEFVSPFKNRLAFETKAMIDSIEEFTDRTLSVPTKMVVIADGDIIRNDVDPTNGQVQPLGYYKFTKETFANRDLLFNAIEWLTDDAGIIAARSKDVKLRLLDKERVKVEQTKWQLLNLAIPIGSILLFGIVYNVIRRRKYA